MPCNGRLECFRKEKHEEVGKSFFRLSSSSPEAVVMTLRASRAFAEIYIVLITYTNESRGSRGFAYGFE